MTLDCNYRHWLICQQKATQMPGRSLLHGRWLESPSPLIRRPHFPDREWEQFLLLSYRCTHWQGSNSVKIIFKIPPDYSFLRVLRFMIYLVYYIYTLYLQLHDIVYLCDKWQFHDKQMCCTPTLWIYLVNCKLWMNSKYLSVQHTVWI